MLSEIHWNYWADDEIPTPHGEQEDVWEYRYRIRGKCRLPDRPNHALIPDIEDGIRFVRHGIDVLMPTEFERDNVFDYFMERPNPFRQYYILNDYGGVGYDFDRSEAALRAMHYFPDSMDIDAKELLASYDRSLDPANIRRPGYVDFPSEDKVVVQLGIRRTKTPDPETIVEGLFYHQFLADEHHWKNASPQLFAEVEAHITERKADDPFAWVNERARIASGYSAQGGGKDCSPLFLAEVYERMASVACNGIPAGHQTPKEYDVGTDEKNALIELYGLYSATVCPEMVAVVLEYARILTPQVLRNNATIRSFFDHLPEMLDNGLNIDRITEFTRAPTAEAAAELQRLESALRLTLNIYRGKKPWWFKEDFSLNDAFLEEEKNDQRERLNVRNDDLGRVLLERLSARGGFAYTYVVQSYRAAGHRMMRISPFTEEDAIDFTAFVTESYGIGNIRRCVDVIEYAFQILSHEEESKRRERLAALREHLDEVKPQTLTIGSLEGREPIFEFPGINHLAATMLGRNIAESGEVHDLRIEFDHLHTIDRKFREPLSERAQNYAPALHQDFQHMERLGLLPGQSREGMLALPVSDKRQGVVRSTDASLGLLDFYAQLKEECGYLHKEVAINYFRFCAVRMPDPWHPPKGFLKFLQIYHEIDVPGWRFSFMEHPNNRAKVIDQNVRREIAKQLLISNMLDAWIMDLLSAEELEGLCAWLTGEATAEDRISIEKEVMEDWRERLELIDNPPPSVTHDDDPEPEDSLLSRFTRYGRRSALEESPEETEEVISSPEERHREAEEKMRRDVNDQVEARTRAIRSGRMVSLQNVFSMLSVLNSMAIAGTFSKEELQSVLRETILPVHMRTVDMSDKPDARIRQGAMLTNLLKLQEFGVIDHEALREAVQRSNSAGDARRTAQDFIDEVLVRCFEQSVHQSLPNATDRVIEIMKKHSHGDSETAERALERELDMVRQDLKNELVTIWDGAQFISPGIVDRLLDELRIPQYVELFGPIKRFNAQVLPRFLPIVPFSHRYDNVQDSNEHSARMFFFVGGRILQQRHAAHHALTTMERHHGESSHVDMSGGTELVTNLSIIRREHDDEEESLPAMLDGLANNLPAFQQHVDQWRLNDMPLGPIGGRWHFGNPVSEKHMELFREVLSLGKTPFRMIHSNTSLIIPGFMSKNEMRMFIYMLALEGLIDPTKPELQIGVTGRLSPELCAYFGSSCMLGTAECAPFTVDSFVPDSTTNTWLTAARIVAYDAYRESHGDRKNFELPFMFDGSPASGKNVEGRTDILGRWNVRWKQGGAKPDLVTMDDIDIAHTVGATLRHVQYGGPLQEVGLAYMERHKEILNRYGLSDTLDAPWVYAREHQAYQHESRTPEHFDRCVKPCMDAHFTHSSGFSDGKGVVFEVRENIDTLIRQVETVGMQIRKDPQYEQDIRAILQVTSYESLIS